MLRAWRRQAGAAQAAGADVCTHTTGECGGAQTVLTQRRCATACAGSRARGTRAQAPTPERGVQQIFFPRPRPHGQARGLGLAALAGVVDDRAEGRKRKPCRLCPRRDGAPEKFGDRGLATGLSFSSVTLTCSGVSQQQQPPIYCVTHAHTTRSTTKPRVYSADELASNHSEHSSRAPELGEDCIDGATCLAKRAPTHLFSSIASGTPLRECVPSLGRAGGASLGRASSVPQRHPRRPLARCYAFDRVNSALHTSGRA